MSEYKKLEDSRIYFHIELEYIPKDNIAHISTQT